MTLKAGSSVLLKAQELTKAYRTGNSERVVLDSVSLDVAEGEFVVIMGPSGAGKSTLLHMLSVMDKPDKGYVEYRGQRISSFSEKETADLWAQDFGFVFQQSMLVSFLTIGENLRIAGLVDASNKSGSEIQARSEKLLKSMGLEVIEDNLPDQVSGGEAQRASVARAVMNRPTIVFADEPTGALNRSNSEEVLRLLTELNRNGQTIVMVTHDHKAALSGSRVLYLIDGEIKGNLNLVALPNDEESREQSLLDWLGDLGW